MKCLICGYLNYDFTGKDGNQVKGSKVALATHSQKKGIEGLEVASVKISADVDLPKAEKFPFWAECDFDLGGRMVKINPIPSGK
jgi:hypothetical protein